MVSRGLQLWRALHSLYGLNSPSPSTSKKQLRVDNDGRYVSLYLADSTWDLHKISSMDLSGASSAVNDGREPAV